MLFQQAAEHLKFGWHASICMLQPQDHDIQQTSMQSSVGRKVANVNDAARAHRGVNVSNTTSPMRLSMMLGVGLGYMPWPALLAGGALAGGDGSGDSPSSFTERRFSAGLPGGAALGSPCQLQLKSSVVQRVA